MKLLFVLRNRMNWIRMILHENVVWNWNWYCGMKLKLHDIAVWNWNFMILLYEIEIAWYCMKLHNGSLFCVHHMYIDSVYSNDESSRATHPVPLCRPSPVPCTQELRGKDYRALQLWPPHSIWAAQVYIISCISLDYIDLWMKVGLSCICVQTYSWSSATTSAWRHPTPSRKCRCCTFFLLLDLHIYIRSSLSIFSLIG